MSLECFIKSRHLWWSTTVTLIMHWRRSYWFLLQVLQSALQTSRLTPCNSRTATGIPPESWAMLVISSCNLWQSVIPLSLSLILMYILNIPWIYIVYDAKKKHFAIVSWIYDPTLQGHSSNFLDSKKNMRHFRLTPQGHCKATVWEMSFGAISQRILSFPQAACSPSTTQ